MVKKGMKSIKYLILFILSINSFINIGTAAEINKPPSPPSGLRVGSEQLLLPSPPPPPPAGNESLLVGMTPGKYSIPPGWTLLRTQDFESKCGADEDCGRASGRVGTTKPHSGSYGIEGSIGNDQAEVGWKWYNPNTGDFSEIYVSFWEYNEAQALFNDEYFLLSIMKRNSDESHQLQHWIVDWYWGQDDSNKPAFNAPKSSLFIIGEAWSEGGGIEFTDYKNGRLDYVPKGSWVQWEIWGKQNTSLKNDGFMRVYKNGNMYIHREVANMNGNVNMSNPNHIMVGGVYTKLVWMHDYPTCTKCDSYPGEGTDACVSSMGWWGQSFSNPRCGSSLPSFKRFIDDIIIMKK